MKELCEAIRTWGRGVGNDIAKVDMFLNHRIDTELLFKMGEAFAEEFRDDYAKSFAATRKMAGAMNLYARQSGQRAWGDMAKLTAYAAERDKTK